jgi:hypothetical protein
MNDGQHNGQKRKDKQSTKHTQQTWDRLTYLGALERSAVPSSHKQW